MVGIRQNGPFWEVFVKETNLVVGRFPSRLEAEKYAYGTDSDPAETRRKFLLVWEVLKNARIIFGACEKMGLHGYEDLGKQTDKAMKALNELRLLWLENDQ